MKKFASMIGGMTMLLMAGQAGAVFISLEPSEQSAAPGDTVYVDVVIDGLGNFAPDSLGAFDIDLGYDTSALTYGGYTLGTFLGDPAFGEAIDVSFGDLGGGLINLAVVSLLLDFELDAIQPSSFSLATIAFTVDVLATGAATTVSVDAASAILGDAFGGALDLDGTSNAVIRNPSTVPEPSILLLLALGLSGVAYRRTKQRA